MRRLPLIDAALVAVLLPVWLVALALHVRQVATGRLAHVGLYVAAPTDPSDYPSIRMFWPGEETRASGLKVGTRLVAIDDVDLSGATPLRFFAIAHEAIARSGRAGSPIGARVTYLHETERETTELPFVPAPYPWRMLPLTVAFVVTGTLVLVRRPGVPVARAFFLAAVVFSLHWTWFFGGERFVTYLWAAVYLAVSALMYPLMLRAASMFPEEVAPAKAYLWPWLFVVNGPIALTGSIGAPLPPELGLRGIYFMNIAFILSLLGVLTRNYARAGLAGRRQMRWGVYGIYVGLAPVLAANLATLVFPDLWWLLDLAAIAEIFIPICIFIAILRSNLYDIDQLITATVVYSVLSVLLLAAVLIIVPPLAEAASVMIGIDRRVGTSGFSVVLALSLLSFYRSLGPRVERALFRERYALRQGVNEFLLELSISETAQTLLERVGDRLVELFRPATCAIYVPAGENYVSVFSRGTRRGGALPPQLSTHGGIVEIVQASDGPLDLEDWQRGRPNVGADRDERTAFQRLAPAVMVPVTVDDTLRALISLGAKRSGDIYAPGDLALLAAVASKIATELRGFDDARRTAAKPVLLPRKYEMVSEVGRGGMGCVYKIRHATLGTTLALKVLPDHLAHDPEVVARFHREARVMAQLQHRHIVRVFDVDVEGSLHYFVMEYIAGESLANLVRTRGPRPIAEVIRITRQIGEALAYAHAHEPAIVHRDIKPANVLIENGTGRAVVTDFGIAKIVSLEETLRTRTGDVFGTIQYCAPEQLRGDRDVDAQADIYSLGIVMHELFSGERFFADLLDHEIVGRILYDRSENTPHLGRGAPEGFHSIVARAIAKDRSRRYRAMAALLADLEELEDMLASGKHATPRDDTPQTHVDQPRASAPQRGDTQLATVSEPAPEKTSSAAAERRTRRRTEH